MLTYHPTQPDYPENGCHGNALLLSGPKYRQI